MPTKYFTGQELPIKLNPGIGALGGTITLPKILYWKPNGTPGSWTAAIAGENFVYTTTKSDAPDTDAGTWALQCSYEVSGDQQYGQKVYETFGIPLVRQ